MQWLFFEHLHKHVCRIIFKSMSIKIFIVAKLFFRIVCVCDLFKKKLEETKMSTIR